MTITPGAPIRLDSLLDRVEDALDDDLLPAEIFNDDDVYRAEIDRIFTNTWVFVGHESELENPGDFVQRRIGVDSVIVTRDGKGAINVLSNYCRHRGTQVCQTDSGNSRFFKCPYHGWTYSNDGDLVGTPLMHRAYGKRLDPKQWGLLRAPKVETYAGLIFASLNPDVPPLVEYLGGMAWMLDLLLNLAPGGMRVAGPPDRYQIKADWKSGAENFAGDTYHVPNLHASLESVEMTHGLVNTPEIGRAFEFENGHVAMCHAWPTVVHPEFYYWGYPREYWPHFDISRLDAAQLQIVQQEPPTIGTVFPNLSFIRLASPSLPGEQPSVITSIRQWQPIGPGQMELWSWQLVWNFETEQEALRAYSIGQMCFGSAGVFEQDDTVAWEGTARAGASPWARKAGLEFHFQQGNESEVDQEPDPTWTGPGTRRPTGYGEHVQLAFYRNWLKVMRGDAASDEGK